MSIDISHSNNYIYVADTATDANVTIQAKGVGSVNITSNLLVYNSPLSFYNPSSGRTHTIGFTSDIYNLTIQPGGGGYTFINPGGGRTAFNNANPQYTVDVTGTIRTTDMIVSGNLSVLGNTTTFNTSQLDIGDSLIYLANNNLTTDLVDIGIIGHYANAASGNAHTGIFRDPNLKEWIFFKDYTPEVQANNLINIAHPSFAYSNVYAGYFKGNVIAPNVVVTQTSTSSFPLTFGTGLGNKIGLYDGGSGAGYGFGIQSSQLQIFTQTAGSVTSIGLGNSSSFTEQFRISTTASAVNYLQVSGNTTGTPLLIAAKGSDTDVSMNLVAKGAGSINFDTVTGTQVKIVDNGSGPVVNYVQLKGSKGSSAVSISAQGTATDVSLELTSKGLNGVTINYSGTSIPSTSTSSGSLLVNGGIGVTGNVWANSVYVDSTIGALYTDRLRYSSNGQPWIMGSSGGASLSGYQANTIVVANSSGYLSNSNSYFTASNNAMFVTGSIYSNNQDVMVTSLMYSVAFG